jgi:Domain of unknown function (DUF5666)
MIRFDSILRAGIFTASLAATTLFAVPSFGQPASLHAQAKATRSAAGKVASISGSTFSLKVGSGGSEQTMQFLADEATKIEGRVTVGSNVVVEYKTDDTGKNVATSILVQ